MLFRHDEKGRARPWQGSRAGGPAARRLTRPRGARAPAVRLNPATPPASTRRTTRPVTVIVTLPSTGCRRVRAGSAGSPGAPYPRPSRRSRAAPWSPGSGAPPASAGSKCPVRPSRRPRAAPFRHAGDGSGRLFVAEQTGRSAPAQDGALVDRPFLDITDRVPPAASAGCSASRSRRASADERGTVYAYYRGRAARAVVSEFRAATPHIHRARPRLRARRSWREPDPYPNHNGGWIGFDPAACSWSHSATGLGRRPGEPGVGPRLARRARSCASTSTTTADGKATDPAGQPVVGRRGRPRSSTRPAQPVPRRVRPGDGRPWIGDVGPGRWEEVDVAPAGRSRSRLRLAALGGPALLRPAHGLRPGGRHSRSRSTRTARAAR